MGTFLNFAIETQRILLRSIQALLKDAEDPTYSVRQQELNHYLGCLRILELAHDEHYRECAEYERVQPLGDFKDAKDQLESLKAKLENPSVPAEDEEEDTTIIESPVSSVVSLRNGGIAALVAVLAYFGYSYWNNSKKAQQSN